MSRLASLKIKAKLLQKAKKKSGKSIQLKEAYEIIAKSAGYHSWREMKQVVEEHALLRPSHRLLPYWNNWYGTYEGAKQHMRPDQDFLLPYEQQFFLCGMDYIAALGISSDDPDLELVGRDWVVPGDARALERLFVKVTAHSQALAQSRGQEEVSS